MSNFPVIMKNGDLIHSYFSLGAVTVTILTKDCRHPNKNPNPNVHKQDLHSSLSAVC